jgi:hypothetical protein
VRGDSPWLVSKRTDLLLFGGSTLLALGLLVAGHFAGILDGSLPPEMWLVLVVAVDVAHVWSTGWKVYADPDEFGQRRALYLALPAFAFAAGVAAHSVSPHLFWRLLAYAAVFHFVRQQYGWVALYRRKNGEEAGPGSSFARRLDAWTIYGATLAPLVWWHARLPRRFHWFLTGDFVPGLPPALGPIALGLFAPILAAYVAKEIVRSRRGSPVSWGKNLVVASTVATWFLGIVVFDSDYAFSVTNVLVHGIPYIGILWATCKARGDSREARGRIPSLADRAARHAAVFVAPLLAVAFLEEWGWDRLVWHDNGQFFPGPAFEPGAMALSIIVPLLALPQATHYLLDGWIWKMRPENAGTARALGLETR